MLQQQNGVHERMNRTFLERLRCMLSNVGLSRCFWVEAINIVCYLINRTPATTINSTTLFKVWFGKTTDYIGLRVFHCPSYYHISEGKLEPHLKNNCL